MPHHGTPLRARTKTKADTSRSTTGARVPAFTGMPPGADKAVPGVPSVDLAPVPGADAAAPAVPSAEIAAAEPISALRPMSEDRPNGLLTVVAVVCVIGVGLGVIRAFVAQRAYRSLVA